MGFDGYRFQIRCELAHWYSQRRGRETVHERLGRAAKKSSADHKRWSQAYVEAVENAFGSEVDFALRVKMYGNDNPDSGKKRAVCVGTQTQVVAGNPNRRLISTSLIERQNLTLRMSNCRFTRKTNAFSKKLRNLEYSIALHYVYYNFVRIHQTLRVTPAMQVGLADHVWSFQELVGLEGRNIDDVLLRDLAR